MEVIVEVLGTKKRDRVINIPEALIVSVRRQDGYEPSVGEVYVALRVGLDSMKNTPAAYRSSSRGSKGEPLPRQLLP